MGTHTSLTLPCTAATTALHGTRLPKLGMGGLLPLPAPTSAPLGRLDAAIPAFVDVSRRAWSPPV